MEPARKNAMQVRTDSEGGYLVPDEFEHTLVASLEKENFFPQYRHGDPDFQREPEDPGGCHKGDGFLD